MNYILRLTQQREKEDEVNKLEENYKSGSSLDNKNEPDIIRIITEGKKTLMRLQSRLVLGEVKFAEQFVACDGVEEIKLSEVLQIRCVLNEKHNMGVDINTLGSDSRVLTAVEALVLLSHLARLSERYYGAIRAADIMGDVYLLLHFPVAIVKAKTCNFIGNICRHSAYFYRSLVKSHCEDVNDRGDFKVKNEAHRLDILAGLFECCRDEDPDVRKFACFAVGNAAFHSEFLYPRLKDVIPLLKELLLDNNENEKTRGNAAGALGNLVRKSGELCNDLVNWEIPELLMNIAENDESLQPKRMALFSLGNLCVYKICRDALGDIREGDTQGSFTNRLHTLSQKTADVACQKYIARILSKLSQPEKE
eukprot:CAMPEP_0204836026 /NCGR_PEP_ID=MMETSP1346-20131115/24210_1 /ASSEMBLY_ACC=CAM_ASM_000771 /TAXON_ID=215587 /ORGANISM="Aplanochytrium stocchinoi, Strain GSBS06" /LENGTH=364 /DNA_ID=CAMNT_0051970489 /DNA_START=47 /DNA_END=1141 /DNA_ORIENTATION=-